jgi:hypothetical protein
MIGSGDGCLSAYVRHYNGLIPVIEVLQARFAGVEFFSPWTEAVILRTLLNHLVGAQQERFGDGQPDRLGGLHIDDQLEFCRLLHRQVRGFGALQNLGTYKAPRRNKSGTLAP